MASNLLWAHLLRKDATTTDDTFSQIPPIAPQDRTGTSMRMLIHDTQANLEQFSTRLDGLLQRVDDCRAQVVSANKLLDVERDKVLTEMLEIAHRCQSEMKTHVGTPAQASTLDLVRVSQASTDKSVQALEKRIDALQTLLQTYAHTMQSIQDQQNTLIGAVLPLVPILHGVSPQMDQIKATLSDMMENAVSTMRNSVENVRSTLVAEIAQGHGHERSSTQVGSSSMSKSSSWRKQSDASTHGPQETNVPVFSRLDDLSHRGPHTSLKRARIEEDSHRGGDGQLPRKLSRPVAPLTISGDRSLLQTPRTPRQPLADLFLTTGSNTSRIQHHTASRTSSTSRGYMRHYQGPSTNSRSISKPPLRPLEHVHCDLQDSTIARQRSAGLPDIPPDVDSFAIGLPNAIDPSDQDALSKAIKIEEIAPKLTGIFSIHSSPLSSPPSSLPSATRCFPNKRSTNTGQCFTQQYQRQQGNVQDASRVELLPLSDPFSSNPDVSPPKSMSLRDRRAQISKFGRTETRRFIPLVPWSDEEE